MSWRTDILYQYDGSFPGFLTCVFECFAQKEAPIHILPEEETPPALFPVKWVETDLEKAQRVYGSILKKISKPAQDLVRDGFLTCLENKERILLEFLRYGYQVGGRVLDRWIDHRVYPLQKAVRHLHHEAHLWKGFIRFSEYGPVLAAKIEPKNTVLPFLAHHFSQRYSGEVFLIYDAVHHQALVHQPGQTALIPMEDVVFPPPGREEVYYRGLWKRFFETIAVEGRTNPRCQRNLMPLWYRRNMTEFQGERFFSEFQADLSEAALDGGQSGVVKETVQDSPKPLSGLEYERKEKASGRWAGGEQKVKMKKDGEGSCSYRIP